MGALDVVFYSLLKRLYIQLFLLLEAQLAYF